jgi:hypothetical protein
MNEPGRGELSLRRAEWLAPAIFLAAYLVVASAVAWHQPLWLDEILSLWTARLASVPDIYSALAHGSDFSPPTYLVLLHAVRGVAGENLLVLRLPSILAALLCGVGAFLLMRRYVGATRATLGMCLYLDGLFEFAVQARAYTLVAACCTLALLLWDGLSREELWQRYAGIALLLALAISLHFYAVLMVPCLGLIELIYSLKVRRIRYWSWCALGVAGASIFLWHGLMQQISRYCAGDAYSRNYYAQPSVERLGAILSDLFLGSYALFVLMVALLLLTAGRLLGEAEDKGEDAGRAASDAPFCSITLGLFFFPIIVFVFSLLVTRTYNLRYLLTAMLGMSAMIVGGLPSNALLRRCLPGLALLAALLPLGALDLDGRPVEFAARVEGDCPIVIADGLQFFPLVEAADPAIRRRVVYLTVPAGTDMGDPTAQHQIERWKEINPRLPVEGVEEFLLKNPKFYVVDRQSSDDTPARYLLRQGKIQLVDMVGKTLIYRSVTN